VFECGLILIDVEGKQLEVAMFRHLRNIGMVETSNLLARDLAGFFGEYAEEVEWSVMNC